MKFIACAVAAGVISISAASGTDIMLAPHRAVYALKLASTSGSRNLKSVNGQILYDFSAKSCAAYELEFRQTTKIEQNNGSANSDLNASTQEDLARRRFRFNSTNRVNDRVVDVVDGEASGVTNGVAVSLHKPIDKSFVLPSGVAFPTEHVREVISAARAGKTVLERLVFDGSENGEKVFRTVATIGPPIMPGAKLPPDATVREPTLARLRRWPTKISYYESGDRDQKEPYYTISFELYENGISRALLLDYGDFAVSGELTELAIKETSTCNDQKKSD
jgi:hypothetical protein